MKKPSHQKKRALLKALDHHVLRTPALELEDVHARTDGGSPQLRYRRATGVEDVPEEIISATL